jgi:hypothetical protein
MCRFSIPMSSTYPIFAKGWDSTHATTLRWTARRSDIDTQLANLRKSRALAIGAAVMTVTQPTVMSPSDDQKWAAYLTVSLSDDEVQSKAATLSISEQDQAKAKAAKTRVEQGKVARGGSLPLSADEQNSINAVLNYTGTSLSQQTQDAAQTWTDAQFTGLTPTSGSAISPIGAGLRFTVTSRELVLAALPRRHKSLGDSASLWMPSCVRSIYA